MDGQKEAVRRIEAVIQSGASVLDLSGLGLESIREPPALPQVRALDLSGNKLEEAPGWIAKLSKLRFADLSRNRLEHLPDWLGNLPLVDLRFRENKIRKLPDWIVNLRTLRALIFGNNPIETYPHQIQRLTNLTRLDLQGIKIKALPAWIFTLEKMESLYLDQTGLVHLSADVERLQALEWLQLEGNQARGDSATAADGDRVMEFVLR